MELDFGKKLMLARKKKGLTQEELAKKIKTTRSTIIRWENSNKPPSLVHVIELSEILNADLPYFTETNSIREPSPTYVADMTNKENVINLPILARVPAGFPEYSEDDVESRILLPRYLYPGAKIAVYCASDSMEPEIMKGEICVVKFTSEPLDNKVMLVHIKGQGWTIKRIKKVKNKIELHSTNPAYKPIIPKDLKIVGQVIGVCKKYE